MSLSTNLNFYANSSKVSSFNLATKAIKLLTLIAIISLSIACSNENKSNNQSAPEPTKPVVSFGYDLKGVDLTGKACITSKNFNTLNERCLALVDDGANNFCATLERRNLFQKDCSQLGLNSQPLQKMRFAPNTQQTCTYSNIKENARYYFYSYNYKNNTKSYSYDANSKKTLDMTFSDAKIMLDNTNEEVSIEVSDEFGSNKSVANCSVNSTLNITGTALPSDSNSLQLFNATRMLCNISLFPHKLEVGSEAIDENQISFSKIIETTADNNLSALLLKNSEDDLTVIGKIINNGSANIASILIIDNRAGNSRNIKINGLTRNLLSFKYNDNNSKQILKVSCTPAK